MKFNITWYDDIGVLAGKSEVEASNLADATKALPEILSLLPPADVKRIFAVYLAASLT